MDAAAALVDAGLALLHLLLRAVVGATSRRASRDAGDLADHDRHRRLALLAILHLGDHAGLGHPVVSDTRLPERIRQALNVESGLNDGLSTPLLLIFIALAGAEGTVQAPIIL